MSSADAEPGTTHGPGCDLVIRGTVEPAGSSAQCDLGIDNGIITQLGGEPRGRRYLDASGALVLPGGIDMRVHLLSPALPDPAESAIRKPAQDPGKRAKQHAPISKYGNPGA